MLIRLDGTGKITGGAELAATDRVNDDPSGPDLFGAQTHQTLVGRHRRRVGAGGAGGRSFAPKRDQQRPAAEEGVYGSCWTKAAMPWKPRRGESPVRLH